MYLATVGEVQILIGIPFGRSIRVSYKEYVIVEVVADPKCP